MTTAGVAKSENLFNRNEHDGHDEESAPKASSRFPNRSSADSHDRPQISVIPAQAGIQGHTFRHCVPQAKPPS
jgi:hypothetical protein